MKFNLLGSMKFGKFDVCFKTMEIKMKADHEVVMLHVKPRKFGFVFAHNEKVFHLAVSALLLHIAITFNK